MLTMKAHSVPPALPAIAPLIGPETAVVTMQNGIPWWYFYRSGGPHEGTRIEAVDPGGVISAAIGPERAIGTAVYVAAEVEAPGVVRHAYGARISLGEPSGEKSERAVRLAEEMIAAGMQAPVRTDIRSEIWVKLWGNLSFNPISALTDSTLADIVADDGTRARGPGDDGRGAGDRRDARRHDSRSTSTSASPAPAASARTAPRCSRTSSAAGRWRSTRW